MTSSGTSQYEMTLSLNVLNHLGLNLYSSNPAVLSEAVANAWDADASRVDITLDQATSTVIVSDDGIGMTVEDINDRFLRVGYRRREVDGGKGALTPSGRAVMGRKGIGKLAMFGIADTILVETAKDGEKNALRMEISEINKSISGSDPSANQTYRPVECSVDSIDFAHGTRITLTNLKKGIDKTAPFLRKRLARRFSIIGAADGFQVFVGGSEVTQAETQLAPISQYIWLYGDDLFKKKITSQLKPHTKIFDRASQTKNGYQLQGWIGTATQPAELKGAALGESLNRIPIFIRGKLAQEDILDEFDEVGIYKNYIFGELHADFLDENNQVDIATSSRQKIKEDDPRYEDLRDWARIEMSHIRSKWTDLRNDHGTADATKNTAIDEWFQTLKGDHRSRAKRLFGKINQLGLDQEGTNELYAYGVLAFETMSQKQNLDALDKISPENLVSLSTILSSASDLEAAMYHRIVSSRLAVIDKLENLVTDNEKEHFLQEHLFSHLWLLDPGWERASVPTMEKRISKIFDKVSAKIPQAEKDSRYDIRYQRTSGMNVIVELKRPGVRTDSYKLIAQTEKYRGALRKYLKEVNRENEPVSVVCVVGRALSDWEDGGKGESIEMLATKETRVVMYDELLADAQAAYKEYLDEGEAIGRVQKVLDSIVKEP